MVDDGQEVPGIVALVDLLLRFPVTPAVKALVAHRYGDAAYLNTAPPLEPTEASARAQLASAFDALLAQYTA
jgi:4-hydroxy-tetrahydrodipicolinate synthase